MAEHRIEFEPGEVIRPDYDHENNLVALYVSDDGKESLREAVCPSQPSGSTGEDGDAKPPQAAPTRAEGFIEEVHSRAEGYRAAGVSPSIIASGFRSLAERYDAIEEDVARMRQSFESESD